MSWAFFGTSKKPLVGSTPPGELLPLSLMLPASGAFHALIRLSLKDLGLRDNII